MHPRLSVNSICFGSAPLAQCIDGWRSLEARRVGVSGGALQAAGVDAGVALLRQSGLDVAALSHIFLRGGLDDRALWPEARSGLSRMIDAAQAIGSATLLLLPGGRGAFEWEAAAAAFCEAIEPCLRPARQAGVALMVEPAPSLYADLSIVHNLRDTALLAEQANIGVCIDIFSCWFEAGLQASIRRAMPRCGLVQISDYVLGDRAIPGRAVPGDGAIPIERLARWMLEAGYQGAFDLELLGPRLDREGGLPATRRAGEHMAEIFARLGA